VIVTVFLAGLLPGAWLGNRLSGGGRRVLLATDLLLILVLGVFLLALHEGGDRLPVAFYPDLRVCRVRDLRLSVSVVLNLGGGGNQAAARAFSADLVGAAWRHSGDQRRADPASSVFSRPL